MTDHRLFSGPLLGTETPTAYATNRFGATPWALVRNIAGPLALCAALAWSASVWAAGASDGGHGAHSHGASQSEQGTHGGGGHGHGKHRPRDVPPGTPAPTLSLKAVKDSIDGYNLRLVVSGFRFSPEAEGRDSDAVEGHAHLYVNGKKLARLYGHWTHLPRAALNPGENLLRVSLNDNLHRPWASEGTPIEAFVTLRNRADETAGREISVHLDGESATRETAVIATAGEALRLVVHVGEPMTLHLHGYDIAADAAPGQPAVFAFTAVHGGRFPLVVHRHDSRPGDSETALLYVEVRQE